MNRDKVKEDIKHQEGCIDHMYLDTEGNVTIGVGQLVPSAQSARNLTLFVRATGERATPQQIDAEYAQVSAQKVGMVASKYKPFTTLEMHSDGIDELLDHRIDEFAQGLSRSLGQFNDFPDAAQEALLDMAFNLGVSGLTRKFPKLVRAAEQHDWDTCAAECTRKGIGDQRNEFTKSLFMSAKAT